MILVIDSLMACYERQAMQDELYEYLVGLQQRNENLFLQDVIASVLERAQGKQAAVEYLSKMVRQQPSLAGLQKLISYKEKEIDADEVFGDLMKAISIMQKDSVEYRCQKCGFSSNTHYWLCPSCNSWGRVKPSVVEHEESQ